MKHRYLVFRCLVLGSFLIFSLPAGAQKAAPDTSKVKISALKAEGAWGDKTGLLLEGTAAQPAHVSHPQLDVTAPKIVAAFDDNRQLTQITATGGVRFAVSLTQKDGPPTRIEAKCDNATLERPVTGANAGARVLTLRGGVDGWYQMEGGPRNSLRGQSVTLTSKPGAAEALLANVEGGAEGVRVELPPAKGGAPDSNHGPVILTAQSAVLRQRGDGLSADVEGGPRGVRMEVQGGANGANDLLQGNVVVTSKRAVVRQNEGMARFIGEAHVVSSGGPRQFDVAADELSLSRNAKGDFEILKTVGRTKVKLDLSQDKPKTPDDKKSPAARPDYLEVEADSAQAQLLKNQLVFEGNVKGFYRLPAADKTAPPGDYQFSGGRVVVNYVPNANDPALSWNIAFTGQGNAPVEITAPFTF